MKVAIIGTGSVAVKNYIPYLSSRPGVSMLYYSRTMAKAEAAAANFGGKVLGSIKDLMSEEPDVVFVLTNETARYDVTTQLLEYKPRRLFFEKPLHARNGQANVAEQDFFEARELIHKTEALGIETAMIFNYRFFKLSRKLKELIDGGNLGQLRQASLFVNYACWSHCLDLLSWFGGELETVSALVGDITYGKGASAGPDLACAFKLENGATGTVIGTSGSNFAFPLYNITLNFEHGMASVSDLDGQLVLFKEGDDYRQTYSLSANISRWNQYSASFRASLAAYMDAIEAGKPVPIPGLAGLKELQFEAAFRRSAATLKAVNVKQDFPL